MNAWFVRFLLAGVPAAAAAAAAQLLRHRLEKRYTAAARCRLWLGLALAALAPVWLLPVSLSVPGFSALPAALTAPVAQTAPAAQAAPEQAGAPAAERQSAASQTAVQVGAPAAASENGPEKTADTPAETVSPAEHTAQNAGAAPSAPAPGGRLAAGVRALWAGAGQRSPLQLAAALWLSGVLALVAVQLAGGLFAAAGLYRRSRPVTDAAVLACSRRAAAALGLRRLPALRLAPVGSPMVAGLLRPVLLLPPQLAARLPEKQLELIFLHELGHVRRHDVAFKLALGAACTLRWFDPLLWNLRARALRDIEFACDELVVSARAVPGAELRAEYCDTLLQVASAAGPRPLCSTRFCDDKGLMMARFAHLFDTGARRAGRAVRTGVLAGVLALSVLASACAAGASASGAGGSGVLTADGISAAPASESVAAASPESGAVRLPVTDAERAAVLDLVRPNEERFGIGGVSGERLYGDTDYIFHFLADKGVLEPYIKNLVYELPAGTIPSTAEFLYGTPVIADNYVGNPTYASDYVRGPSLEREYEVYRLKEDGNIKASVVTSYNGDAVYRTFYELEPAVAGPVPEILQGLYTEGQPMWRIVSVAFGELDPAVGRGVPRTVEIGTAEQLLAAAGELNRNGYLYGGTTFRLTADIDLSGVDWVPITGGGTPMSGGTEVLGFTGTFDGGGHTVSHLTVKNNVLKLPGSEWDGHVQYSGLFYSIASSGTVKNLTFTNASILNENPAEPVYVSAAGVLAAESYGTVQNCRVENSTVQSVSSAGGLIGMVRGGTLENCSVYGSAVTGSDSLGLFTSYFYDTSAKNCTVEGTVTVVPYAEAEEDGGTHMPGVAGGFCGFEGSGTLENCVCDAEVLTLTNSQYIGSFCGTNSAGAFTGCAYNGDRSNWPALGAADTRGTADGQPQALAAAQLQQLLQNSSAG